MSAEVLYLSMFLLFALGTFSGLLLKGSNKLTNYIAHGLAALGCLAAILCAIFVLHGFPIRIILAVDNSLPFGTMSIYIDNLSAYFLLIAGIIGLMTSLFALGYSQEYYGLGFRRLTSLYNAFLLSIMLVLTVSHVIAFIIVWEVMSVVSFFLVTHEHKRAVSMRAGFIYIVMTHLGTVFIFSAFLIVASAANSMDFLKFNAAALDEASKNIIFLCAFIGFGAKAGVIPLHIWLPKAHPAAPSHVSALMSGVMIKTAVYGVCRFVLCFLGPGPLWWGGVVLLAAVISCVLGILYALMENDVKRLLAYSSVENIGIILLGIGAGMVFTSLDKPMLAGLSWTACFFHIFNHAIFKALLFMAAGAIIQAAHTKNMENLGGLIKKMPYTASCFLVGVSSISALPLFNGFVSEWLTFQALFFLPQVVSGFLGEILGVLIIALFGLTGALAAATFVKAYGIIFLAKPRSKGAAESKEVNQAMLMPIMLLSVLCAVIGIWPWPLLNTVQKALVNISNITTGDLFHYAWYSIIFSSETMQGTFAMPLGVFFFLGGLTIAFFLYYLHGKPTVRISETWTCGIIPGSHMEYTSTGFSKPIRLAFKTILRSQHETLVDASSNRYFGRRLSYHVRIKDIFREVLYRPSQAAILKAAGFIKVIQTGSVQLYIGYIMAVTVLVLILSSRW